MEERQAMDSSPSFFSSPGKGGGAVGGSLWVEGRPPSPISCLGLKDGSPLEVGALSL